MKLQSFDLLNEDLCDAAHMEVDEESIIGVNDDLINIIEVSHPKFNTDLHPLVVGLQYKGWTTAVLPPDTEQLTPAVLPGSG